MDGTGAHRGLRGTTAPRKGAGGRSSPAPSKTKKEKNEKKDAPPRRPAGRRRGAAEAKATRAKPDTRDRSARVQRRQTPGRAQHSRKHKGTEKACSGLERIEGGSKKSSVGKRSRVYIKFGKHYDPAKSMPPSFVQLFGSSHRCPRMVKAEILDVERSAVGRDAPVDSFHKRGFMWTQLSRMEAGHLRHLQKQKTNKEYVLSKHLQNEVRDGFLEILRGVLQKELGNGGKVQVRNFTSGLNRPNFRSVTTEQVTSAPLVHNDYGLDEGVMWEPGEDAWKMVNIWVALDDELVSHPLAMVTHPGWKNHAPPEYYFELGHREQEHLLCEKAKHLVYHVKDMKQFDAIVFLTASTFHTALYAGDLARERNSVEFRAFYRIVEQQ